MTDQQKQFVFGDAEGDSIVTVTVNGEFHDPDEGYPRPVYGYNITTESWGYSQADIHGGCGETPDLDKASQSLFAFLSAAAEARDESSENWSLFPDNVRLWAQRYSDEIAELSMESERRVSMAMVDGSLVESDEDTTEF